MARGHSAGELQQKYNYFIDATTKELVVITIENEKQVTERFSILGEPVIVHSKLFLRYGQAGRYFFDFIRGYRLASIRTARILQAKSPPRTIELQGKQ